MSSNGIQYWDKVPIVVPKVTPSGGLPFCCLFEISYVIKVHNTIKHVARNFYILLLFLHS